MVAPRRHSRWLSPPVIKPQLVRLHISGMNACTNRSYPVARAPSKLTNILTTQHSLPAELLDSNLTIIQGDVKSNSSVRSTLYHDNRLADIIIFGVGSFPKFQSSLFQPVTLDDPHICGDAMGVITNTLRAIHTEQHNQGMNTASKPLILAISTTGLDNSRDVPFVYLPLYHWLLSIPHADKRVMEETLAAACGNSSLPPVGDFVVVRPTLLLDGPPKGNVRVGWILSPESKSRSGAHAEEAPCPAVGYTIRRSDVGSWIFNEVVERTDRNAVWAGKFVTLTY